MSTSARRLAAFVLLLAAACAPPARQPVTTWDGKAARVLLEYRGEARAVYATGDFNEWSLTPFARQEPERWELTLSLPPGEYGYLLAVETDSEWALRPDPANPLRQDDAAGRSLSLLRVGNDNGGDD